jgi:agmatinase
MDEILERGLATVVKEAVRAVAEAAPRIYLSIDIDVLDPAFAPGTGTPEPGGFTTRELLWTVRHAARELDLCSVDVVEVCPAYDGPGQVTALVAANVAHDFLGLIALQRKNRDG